MTQQGWSSAHGGRRAECFRARGKTQNITKLKYNIIIKGIGYKSDKQTRRNDRNNSKEMDNSELHSESDNEIEQKEQARAREDKSMVRTPPRGGPPVGQGPPGQQDTMVATRFTSPTEHYVRQTCRQGSDQGAMRHHAPSQATTTTL
jgi:hypothetical protein